MRLRSLPYAIAPRRSEGVSTGHLPYTCESHGGSIRERTLRRELLAAYQPLARGEARRAGAGDARDRMEVEAHSTEPQPHSPEKDQELPRPVDAEATPAQAVEMTMQALKSAWAVSKQRKVMGKPKPVPNADGWQIYWVKRSNSSNGDNYFITPGGNKLASLTASRRWLSMFGGAAVGGAKGQAAIDTHGRLISDQPKEKQREASRLLAVAELRVGRDGTVPNPNPNPNANPDPNPNPNPNHHPKPKPNANPNPNPNPNPHH